MIFYDINGYDGEVILVKFEEWISEVDSAVFRSFHEAKAVATDRLKSKIRELEDDLRKIEAINFNNIETVKSPFTDYLRALHGPLE